MFKQLTISMPNCNTCKNSKSLLDAEGGFPFLFLLSAFSIQFKKIRKTINNVILRVPGALHYTRQFIYIYIRNPAR